MKRKLFFASLLILVLVTLSCVSAADDIQANDMEAIDDVQSEDISISDDSESEEILTDGESGTGSLTDLKDEIINSGTTEFNLTRNYTYDESEDKDYWAFANYIGIDNLVLDGKGHTLNGGHQSRIFDFPEGKNITLKNINFVNATYAIYVQKEPIHIINCNFTGCSGGAIFDDGSSTIEYCDFIGNSDNLYGAAIYSKSNTTIYDCDFQNNIVTTTTQKGYGGAIYLDGSSPFVISCYFTNNTVASDYEWAGGGAIYCTDNVKNAYILGCQFNGNSACEGGAIRAYNNVIINHCGFNGNKAAFGGAVYTSYTISIHNSSFYDNVADYSGGALYTSYLTLTNSRFIGNNASERGGAIDTSDATISNSTFERNHAENGGGINCFSSLTIDSSAFKDNTNNSGISDIYPYHESTKISLSNVDTGNEIIANAASYSINSGGTYKATVKGTDGNALAGENVTLVVGNKTIASGISDENGVVAIKLTANILKGVKAGTHDLHVRLTNLYQDKVVKLTVKKDAAAITAKTATFVINYAGKYSVTLKNSAGKLLSGQNVTFTLNGKSIGSAKTNSKGVATITLTAKVLKAAKYGTKNLVIKLNSPLYTASSKTVKVKINKEKTSLVAANKAFKKSLKVKKYTVTLKNSKGKVLKNYKISLKVNGKTYKVATNSKGQAIFKITNLKKKGTFKTVINYAGNSYYNKVSKTVKITVK